MFRKTHKGYRRLPESLWSAAVELARTYAISLCMFSVMDQAFMNSFLSQKNASFPSYEYDGPFSRLAQHIQVQQYQRIKRCLGREWFYHHDSPLIRATRGLVFLKEMQPEEFYQSCRKLKESME